MTTETLDFYPTMYLKFLLVSTNLYLSYCFIVPLGQPNSSHPSLNPGHMINPQCYIYMPHCMHLICLNSPLCSLPHHFLHHTHQTLCHIHDLLMNTVHLFPCVMPPTGCGVHWFPLWADMYVVCSEFVVVFQSPASIVPSGMDQSGPLVGTTCFFWCLGMQLVVGSKNYIYQDWCKKL